MAGDENAFDFSLDTDDYDPLEDDADEEDSGENEKITVSKSDYDYSKESSSVFDEPENSENEKTEREELPAEERTANLFKSMAPRRKILLGILSFCKEQQPIASVETRVDELQKMSYSVYSPANLCSLLEKAGAINRVTSEGGSVSESHVEPKIVEINGAQYYEPADYRKTYWKTTAAGLAYLESDKPLDRLQELFDSNKTYLRIYKRVLTLCSAEGGAAIKTINSAVNDDPLVQEPRFYAPHFVDQLEKCEALDWHKAWVTTEVGKTALEDMLAGVEDGDSDEQRKSEQENKRKTKD